MHADERRFQVNSKGLCARQIEALRAAQDEPKICVHLRASVDKFQHGCR